MRMTLASARSVGPLLDVIVALLPLLDADADWGSSRNRFLGGMSNKELAHLLNTPDKRKRRRVNFSAWLDALD